MEEIPGRLVGKPWLMFGRVGVGRVSGEVKLADDILLRVVLREGLELYEPAEKGCCSSTMVSASE